MTETLEHTARRIADRGREALILRLRPAFEQAAAAHADLIELSQEQVEQMVQRAADRADGLQWRRALAGVATEELKIGFGEALGHPAVKRAQAIVGAPPYEESLAKLTTGQSDQPADADTAETAVASAPKATTAPTAPPATAPDRASEPPAAGAVRGADGEGESATIRLPARHLGGIAGIAPAESGLELIFSDHGLNVVRDSDRTSVARMTWHQIHGIEVPDGRGRLRRRRPSDAHVVLRSVRGNASFEIPGATPEEVREHLGPILEQL